MSSLNKNNKAIKKPKRSLQKPIQVASDLSPVSFIDKLSVSNQSMPIQPKPKKYPKSPFLQKPQGNKDRAAFIKDLQVLRHGDCSTVLTSKQFKHKKGKSMDFQEEGLLNHYLNSKQQNREDLKNRQKVIINKKFIEQSRARNTVSEMRRYPNFRNVAMEIEQLQKNNQKNKQKNNKSQLDKNGKTKIKMIKNIESQPDHLQLKKHSFSWGVSTKPSSNIGKSSKINHGLKEQYRSMDLTVFQRCKSSLPQKAKRRRSVSSNKIGTTQPLPSKLNSLYSNTTSLFSSKKELQPMELFKSFRIPTQQPINEIFEIRKYESALLQQHSTDKQRKSTCVQQSQQNRVICQQTKTHQIIKQYLHIFKQQIQKDDQNQITSAKQSNFKKKPSFQFHHKIQNQQLSLLNSFQTKIQSENKINQVIKIISETDALGEQKKQIILKKIRQIVPIAKIGSKQIQRHSQLNLSNLLPQKNSTPTDSLKSSLVADDSLQIMNIKLLDQALRQRQLYLKSRLDKELERLQSHKEMSHQDIEIEKRRLQKWTKYQIKEASHTRVQLWKGVNFAKKILQEQKDGADWKKNQMMRCLSDKILLKNNNKKKYIQQKEENANEKGKEKQEKTDKNINIVQDNLLKDQQQQQQKSLKNKAIFEIHFNDIQSEENSMDNPISNLSQQNIAEWPKVQFSESPLDIQQDSDKGQINILKNHIFIDSAEKIDYDFQDDSPNINGPQKKQSFSRQIRQYNQELSDQCEEIRQFFPQPPYSIIEKTAYAFLPKISQQAKQDIVQFIFLDLCVQLADDDKDDKIMPSIQRFIQSKKQSAKRPKGFKASSIAVKAYLAQFATFLNHKPQLLVKVQANLQKPMGPTTLQILKYLHPPQSVTSIKLQNQQESEEAIIILDTDLFEMFQKEYIASMQIDKYYDDTQQEKRRLAFLRNAMHIHNKAIFDSLNEQLDKHRPYGQWGEPFKWKKIAKFSHNRNSQQINQQILRSIQSTVVYSQYMCGFIQDKQQCQFRDNPNVTAAHIENIRSDRLIKLLEDYETEDRLMFIDDEETQLLVAISRDILGTLLAEVAAELGG